MQTLHPPSTGGGQRSRVGNVTWLLDAASFHHEFDALFSHLSGPAGTAPLRERATTLWQSSDPVVADYVSRLPFETPEEWEVGFEEHHLGQWYRLLMAAYLTPGLDLEHPTTLRQRLPELGWSPADARRVAHGRELVCLAELFGAPGPATALALVLGTGNKGWLSQDDVDATLRQLQSLDRRAFRRAQELVPACDDLWTCLESAAAHPDRVVLVLPAIP